VPGASSSSAEGAAATNGCLLRAARIRVRRNAEAPRRIRYEWGILVDARSTLPPRTSDAQADDLVRSSQASLRSKDGDATRHRHAGERRRNENPGMANGEWIGWLSSLVLVVTLGLQVRNQWRTGQSSGVSRWLFTGQLAASLGFALYSLLLENWVFLSTNLVLATNALLGQWVTARNRERSDANAVQPSSVSASTLSSR
jgi:hypothetical protein